MGRKPSADSRVGPAARGVQKMAVGSLAVGAGIKRATVRFNRRGHRH